MLPPSSTLTGLGLSTPVIVCFWNLATASLRKLLPAWYPSNKGSIGGLLGPWGSLCQGKLNQKGGQKAPPEGFLHWGQPASGLAFHVHK